MKLPITPEHEARVKEINKELVTLSEARQRVEAELEDICRRINRLWRERDVIERTYVEVRIITTREVRERSLKDRRASGRPIDTQAIAKGLDKAQASELLTMLLRMQKEQEREEGDE